MLYTSLHWSDLIPWEADISWKAPVRPAEITETRLIAAILKGHFPVESTLPAERELAAQLGVTRSTLREALQRLARDGWIEIRHGLPTRVRNYWIEGNLGVLGAIARHQNHTPPDFVPNLLTIRHLLAPAYARAAVVHHPERVIELLEGYTNLTNTAKVFAIADWELHRQLTINSGNPVFTLILNGFKDLYQRMAPKYFKSTEARAHSRIFYHDLLVAARAHDIDAVENITRRVMLESLDLWQVAAGNQQESYP
jgi:GntR family negative regulator for fad regulon and positive regulator of fabA